MRIRVIAARVLGLCLLCLCLVHPATANGSLFSSEGTLVRHRLNDTRHDRGIASLFLKAPDHGLLAASKPFSGATGPQLHAKPAQLVQLRHLIESAESRHAGYDAVQHGATIKPGKKPTRMTLSDIFAWIEATPGQPHAIGRYQFIPETLRRLVARLNLSHSARFSPAVQDQLADVLLVEAGINALQSGKITREGFMHNLSKIWAGLPSANGKSYYHGFAGNKASISWATFQQEMTRIFPG